MSRDSLRAEDLVPAAVRAALVVEVALAADPEGPAVEELVVAAAVEAAAEADPEDPVAAAEAVASVV